MKRFCWIALTLIPSFGFGQTFHGLLNTGDELVEVRSGQKPRPIKPQGDVKWAGNGDFILYLDPFDGSTHITTVQKGKPNRVYKFGIQVFWLGFEGSNPIVDEASKLRILAPGKALEIPKQGLAEDDFVGLWKIPGRPGLVGVVSRGDSWKTVAWSGTAWKEGSGGSGKANLTQLVGARVIITASSLDSKEQLFEFDAVSGKVRSLLPNKPEEITFAAPQAGKLLLTTNRKDSSGKNISEWWIYDSKSGLTKRERLFPAGDTWYAGAVDGTGKWLLGTRSQTIENGWKRDVMAVQRGGAVSKVIFLDADHFAPLTFPFPR